MGWGYGGDYGFRPYVSVAARRATAAKEMAKLTKKGRVITPVKIDGRTIAASVWGKAWCVHLESYSDFENRLPRGRTYVRNGSVVDLQIGPGKITAMVMGSELYEIEIAITPLKKNRWDELKTQCAGKIKSVLELLKGGVSAGVMEVMAHRETGMFPAPKEIKMDCSCPDWAGMCKHLAAVLYGVGARLDTQPELLFTLRNVDPAELVAQATAALGQVPADGGTQLAGAELSEVFGIDLVDETAPAAVGALPKAASAARAAPEGKRKAAYKPGKPPQKTKRKTPQSRDKTPLKGKKEKRRKAAPIPF
jgi:uncharacterized Zn finger protein